MIKFLKFLVLSTLILSCAGPATQRLNIDSDALDAETKLQQTLALQKIKERYERLQRVGYPILKNSSDLCDNTVNSIGVMFNAYVDTDKYSEIEKEVYGIDEEGIKVTYVIPSSTAFKSGLRINDEILKINNLEVSSDREKFHKGLEKFRNKSETLKVEFLRDGVSKSVSLSLINI